jgi:hypothetical protein
MMPYLPPNEDVWSIPNPEAGRHYRWLNMRPDRLGLWLRSYGNIPGYRLEQKETVAKTTA